MKKSLFILTLFSAYCLNAQNLDNTKLTQTEYSRPPMTNSLQSVKSIFVDGTGDHANEARNAIENKINKNAYTIVGDKAVADLIVSVYVNKSTVSTIRTGIETVQKTDKNGKPYTETTHYAIGADKFNVTLKFLDNQGVIIRSVSGETLIILQKIKHQHQQKHKQRKNITMFKIVQEIQS